MSNENNKKWQEWSAWSDCSISCGLNVEGYQMRKRKCDQSNEKNEKCEDEEEIRPCFPTVDCPIEPPTMWSEWTKCSTTCGNGTRSRIRYCSKKSYDFPCEGKELIMEKTLCSSYVGCSSSSSSSSSSNNNLIYPSRLNGFGSYKYNLAPQLTTTSSNQLFSSFVNKQQPNSYASLLVVNEKKNQQQMSIHDICSKYCEESDKKYNDPLCVNFSCNQTATGSSSATWSKWSTWSDCEMMPYANRNSFAPRLNCDMTGLRTKRRVCLLGSKVVSNAKCFGLSFLTSKCQLKNCSSSQQSSTGTTPTTPTNNPYYFTQTAETPSTTPELPTTKTSIF